MSSALGDTPPDTPPPPGPHSLRVEGQKLIFTPPVAGPVLEKPTDVNTNITLCLLRSMRSRARHVPVLPDDSVIITPPRAKKPRKKAHPALQPRPISPPLKLGVKTPAPSLDETTTAPSPDVTRASGTTASQRDTPGMRGGARQAPCANGELPPRADRQDDLPAPVITADCMAESAAAKPTGKKCAVSAKKERLGKLKDKASDAPSLDALAEVLQETIAAMQLLGGALTKPLYELLEEIQTHESRESFSSVVTRAVSSPVKALTVHVEAQQRAIQSLTKTVESFKNAPILAAHACGHGSFAKAAAASPSPPKPKPLPLPNPSDERLLVHFNGQVPPFLALPYPDILTTLNESLGRLGLPLLLYMQKQLESGIFIVPHNKNDLRVLTERWKDWGPSILPGGRVAPVATHCFLQVDGVPFAGAGTLEELCREFEERNPQLGPMAGTPTWVNKPPSEAAAAAVAGAGRKPPRAGSLFIRLQSRDMVDKAIAGGHVILAGTVPAVGRGFPHLRVVRCRAV
ncbi:hypothetical protein DFH09DRAFT_1083983 [Mycena vulgaris]|nr:hypothetical protein DFH09DRAFT_1083983 [Mycena vulgaris]